MRCKLLLFIEIIFMILVSQYALSYGLKEADETFNDRKNFYSLIKAKNMYEYIIKNSDINEEKIHAFDRFSRLSVLEGQLAPFVWGKAVKNSSEIFEHCIDISSSFSKEALGYDVPEYSYWRAICIGLWASNASIWSLTFKLFLIQEMISLINFGQREYPDFDGGAFALLAAGLKIRSRLLKVINIYDPEGAIAFIDQTQAQGNENYTSYLLKAEAQMELSREEEAKATLQTGINSLESKIMKKKLNTLMDVESVATLYLLKESIKKLSFYYYRPIVSD